VIAWMNRLVMLSFPQLCVGAIRDSMAFTISIVATSVFDC
jgi:hypothetical protein